MQIVTPENSNSGLQGVLGSDTNQLEEPEEWYLAIDSVETLDQMIKEIFESCTGDT